MLSAAALFAAAAINVAGVIASPQSLQGIDNPDWPGPGTDHRASVVQFWASWCQSCSGVGEDVADAIAATKSDATYAAISTDEDLAAAHRGAAQLKQKPVSGKLYLFDRDHAFAKALGGITIPTVLVLDAEGRILARLAGHFGAAQRGALQVALKKAAETKNQGAAAATH